MLSVITSIAYFSNYSVTDIPLALNISNVLAHVRSNIRELLAAFFLPIKCKINKMLA